LRQPCQRRERSRRAGRDAFAIERKFFDRQKYGYNTRHRQKLNKEEPHMGRPVGVTILAILCFLGALACIGFGILSFVGGGLSAVAGSQTEGAGGAGAMLGALGAAAGVVCLIIGAIDFLLGWGLWKLKNWARIITLILMAIGVVFGLIGLVGTLLHFNLFSLILTLIYLAVYCLIIWYLLRADVRAAFQGSRAAAAAA
jgi:hypothetical protein